MQTFSMCATALSLAACSPGQQQAGNVALEKAVAPRNTQAADDGRIVCAPAGNNTFSRQCTIDRTQSAQGLVLTVSKPDGGFHRLLVKSGYGVVAADGAEAPTVTIIGENQIEVAIGGDRFRLPATVKSVAAKSGK